jgi:hypothetical protein
MENQANSNLQNNLQNDLQNDLRLLLRNKINSKRQSRTNNVSHENHFRKLKVPEKIISRLVECLKYTNHVCPYPDQILKTFKDLSESDIDVKVKEIDAFLSSRKV